MQQSTVSVNRYKVKRGAKKEHARGSTVSTIIALLVCIVVISGCGATVQSHVTPLPTATLSGNWQFTMAPPGDGSFSGGLQGGFLTQTGNSATGAVAYSVFVPSGTNACSSGSAMLTGTVTDRNVTVTAVAGNQIYTLTGTITFDASSIAGTYTSTAGTALDGSPCGTAQSGLQWSAVLVPPLTGSLQGNLHSAGGSAGLVEQDFLVSGALTQGPANGSSASLAGNLSFVNPVSDLTDYPCAGSTSLNGQISGNTVALQMIAGDGSTIGQIGATIGAPSILGAVTFVPGRGTYVLQAISGFAYAVYAEACGGGTIQSPADFGSICLALNSSIACAQPITFTPPAVVFASELEGSISIQEATLTNSSSLALNNLTISLSGAGAFTEIDNCGTLGVPTNGQPFTLTPSQSCVIQITFMPQCTGQCPTSFSASVILNSPANGMVFTLPVVGMAEAAKSRQLAGHGKSRKSSEKVRNAGLEQILVLGRGSRHAEVE